MPPLHQHRSAKTHHHEKKHLLHYTTSLLSGSPPGGSARSVLEDDAALRQVGPDGVGPDEVPSLPCVKAFLDRCLNGIRIFGTTSEPGLGSLGQQTHEMAGSAQVGGRRHVA